MLETMLSYLQYPFMQRALIVGALVSLCAALLGVSLVLKRYSMIGDGLSHVGFCALSVAAAANLAPLVVAIPVVMAAAFVLLRLNERTRVKGDAAHRHVFHHRRGGRGHRHLHDQGHGRGQRLSLWQDTLPYRFGRGHLHRPVRGGAGHLYLPLPPRVRHYLRRTLCPRHGHARGRAQYAHCPAHGGDHRHRHAHDGHPCSSPASSSSRR